MRLSASSGLSASQASTAARSIVGKQPVDIGVQVVFGYGIGPSHRGLLKGMIIVRHQTLAKGSWAWDSLDMMMRSELD